MEFPRSPERIRIESTAVAHKLLAEGVTEEGIKLLDAWLSQEELRVERGEITNLERNVSWASLYRDAGMEIEAREAFEDAQEQAFQEGYPEIENYCIAELYKLS